MQPQTIKEHFADIMSSDGVPLSFDAYVKLRVTDSVRLVDQFSGAQQDVDLGEGQVPAWYGMNLQGPIRNIVRSAVKKHGLNEVAITYAANEKIESEVRDGISAYLHAQQLPVVLVDFNLGKANPPDSVRDQRIRTASEQQRQITEQQTTLAEEARKAAETARAAADNAYRESLGLSPEQFIQLQQIEMQHDVCDKNRCVFVAPGASALVAPDGR
jgi:regulator of protease activity HflC (stomatin/prohibitin superfamily)